MSDRICTAVLPDLGFTLCGEPAIAAHRYACVHEHVKDKATCSEHQPRQGVVGCFECLEAGHECAMEAQLLEVIE